MTMSPLVATRDVNVQKRCYTFSTKANVFIWHTYTSKYCGMQRHTLLLVVMIMTKCSRIKRENILQFFYLHIDQIYLNQILMNLLKLPKILKFSIFSNTANHMITYGTSTKPTSACGAVVFTISAFLKNILIEQKNN